MDIDNFLNNVAAGNANDARENINDILSAKAFEALDDYKQEIAKAMFAPEVVSQDQDQDQENTDEVTG